MELREALYEAEQELRELGEQTRNIIRALFAALSDEAAEQALRDHGITEEEIAAMHTMLTS